MFRRFVIAIGIVSGSAVALHAQDAAKPAPPTFHSAADVVTIQAAVRDARGRVVSGLTSEDFEVRDNGQLRSILSLRSDRESPISLAILVDMSGSMRIGPKIAMARQAYDSILSQLRQGEDEVALFTFDSGLHERHGFTRDLAALKDGLTEFEPFGTTSLYDGTAAVARQLTDRAGARKAVVVLTDGIDTSSALTAREVSGVASAIDVPVFVVATMPSADLRLALEQSDRGGASSTADLRDLADWTGGQLVFTSSFAETLAATSRLVDDLRQRYVLAVEAATGREWRRLDVRVRLRSTTVKARSGYFAG
jgi:Ca-activated chloride channel family protein